MSSYGDDQYTGDGEEPRTNFHRQPPYIIGFERGEQVFYYLGADHSPRPEHPQFGIFEIYWNAFVSHRQPNECIALVEGGETPVYGSLEETIQQEREAGWVAWRSQQAGIICVSPEPDEKESTRALVDKFGEDSVAHYYFMRELVQWHRMEPRPDYRAYFSFVRHWPDRYGLQADLDLDRLEELHTKATGRTFDPEDRDYFYQLSNPHENLGVTNRVAASCTEQRDQHIIQQIKQYWDEGKSIFAVYGFSHVIEQEAELKRLLT